MDEHPADVRESAKKIRITACVGGAALVALFTSIPSANRFGPDMQPWGILGIFTAYIVAALLVQSGKELLTSCSESEKYNKTRSMARRAMLFGKLGLFSPVWMPIFLYATIGPLVPHHT